MTILNLNDQATSNTSKAAGLPLKTTVTGIARIALRLPKAIYNSRPSPEDILRVETHRNEIRGQRK